MLEKLIKILVTQKFFLETKLIDKTILTNKEKDWLNNYHERVYASISPYLEESEKKWLFEKCQAI